VSQVNEPKYFIADGHRYLVMSIDFFAGNAPIIEDILYKHGFDTRKVVTRIDDPDQNVVTFVQSLEDGADDDEDVYFRGRGTRSDH